MSSGTKSSLEHDLAIPPEATLMSSARYALKTSSGSQINICGKTSLRASSSPSHATEPAPRCLVVGRQASTADIRIQHKSISRRHAALYILSNNSKNHQLILQDLGGKHGVHINNARIPSNQTIVLNSNDTIVFGNVRDTIFSVVVDDSGDGGDGDDSKSEVPNGGKDETKPMKSQQPQQQSDQEDRTMPTEDPGAGLLGRAKREAEIAAMMASLDDTPSYQKYEVQEEGKSQQRMSTQEGGSKNGSAVGLPNKKVSSTIAQKYALPVADNLPISSSSDDEHQRRHVVTCLAVDPTGSRFVVGGNDMHLRFFNFAGMNSTKTDPFKTVEVEEGHVVVGASYSNTGDRLIVGTGSNQPKVLDRDGQEIIQFVRGDMYVTDPARTVGHTHPVTGVDWHPLQRNIVLTGSLDGSARLWNLNGKTQFEKLVCDKVYRAKNERGQKVAVTCVLFHPGGREFVFGTACGSIQIWNSKRVGTRPDRAVYSAHGQSKPIHSLVYSVDGLRLASRSMDDNTVKVWDAHKLSRSAKPIAICKGLSNDYEHCNAAFNHNAQILCAGSSELIKLPDGKRVETGKLMFYNLVSNKGGDKSPNLDPIYEQDIPPGKGVILVRWHSKLNQIFVGYTDGSAGVFYDPAYSSKGALLAAAKAGRRVDELSQLLASRAPTGSAGVRGEILTPNALPMFQQGQFKRKRREDQNDLAIKTRKPEPPATGIKTGGQTSTTGSFQQIVSQSILQTKNIAGKDPREELFKYTEGKNYVTGYEGDEERILAETTVEEEEEKIKEKKT